LSLRSGNLKKEIIKIGKQGDKLAAKCQQRIKIRFSGFVNSS